MQTRSLGDTGLEVTRLGLGLAALGRPGYLNLGHGEDLTESRSLAALEHHTHGMLDTAWQSGIRYIDTARSYGRAEAFLGSWLSRRDVPPDSITIGSKWGYRYAADWRVDAVVHEVKDLSVGHFESQYRETSDLLGPYLNLYQIHSATPDVLGDRAVLHELAALRNQGVIIGLSVSGPQQPAAIRRAAGIEIDGGRLFGTVQATWNLLEPSAGAALAEAHDAGLGVIVKEALANGRLTDRDHRLSGELRNWQPGPAPDSVALATVLAQPWADVVLSGATTTDQLSSNLEALNLTDLGDLPSIAEGPEAYWSTRSGLVWT